MSLDLTLAGHWLRLAGDQGLLSEVASVLVPPCGIGKAADCDIAWSVFVQEGVPDGLGQTEDAGLPVLRWPGPGRELVVSCREGGVIVVAARYRHGSATALIEADAWNCRTLVRVPPGDTDSRRWADWVARAFFGSRLLADGWRLTHASAVRLPASAGGRAVVVLADQHGGKSTVAYRACAELGGALMADDLVLIRPGLAGVEVIGWPARACVPVEVLSRELLASLPREMLIQTDIEGTERSRVVLSPPEYEQVLGISRADPAMLGGIVRLVCAPGGGKGCAARGMDVIEAAKALAASAATAAQRLMMTDLLGLAGGQAVHARSVRADQMAWPQALAGVRAVAAEVADISALPQISLRELTGGLLSDVRVAQ